VHFEPIKLFWSQFTHLFCKLDRFINRHNFKQIPEMTKLAKRDSKLTSKCFTRLAPIVASFLCDSKFPVTLVHYIQQGIFCGWVGEEGECMFCLVLLIVEVQNPLTKTNWVESEKKKKKKKKRGRYVEQKLKLSCTPYLLQIVITIICHN
jgi:hypothetical protein